MTAETFLARVKASGVKVVEVSGWKTRNRNTGRQWGPVHGVMIHHTVTSDTKNTVELVRKGYGDLPGPLYAGVVAKDGTLHLIGWGRCNHAGKGDPDVLKAVIAETPTLPVDNEATVDGNAHFYGFAYINEGDGKDPYTDAQHDTMAKIGWVITDHHHWTERSLIAHADWQPGKPDPHPHPKIRLQIASQIATWRRLGGPGREDQEPGPPTTIPGVLEYVKKLEERVADLERWRNTHDD